MDHKKKIEKGWRELREAVDKLPANQKEAGEKMLAEHMRATLNGREMVASPKETKWTKN